MKRNENSKSSFSVKTTLILLKITNFNKIAFPVLKLSAYDKH